MFSSFDELVNRPVTWLSGAGEHADIVLSSRIRLARNLNEHRYPVRAETDEAREIVELVKVAVEKCELAKDGAFFDADDLERPLSGSIPELASATDRIAENYIESLDNSAVATAVSRMLVQTLPSGRSDQDTVARRLARSRSTLQRQLTSEGTSYREILDKTRLALAERYLVEGDHTQAQIAFMVGFADQSNFARAFKRWTGVSPGEYQKAA